MSDEHKFLVRLAPELYRKLRRASGLEGRSMTEITREALAIRLQLPGDKVDALLERMGYERETARLGWDDIMAATSEDAVSANGSEAAGALVAASADPDTENLCFGV